MNIKITGSGSYIPTEIVSNKDFAEHVFLNDDGTPFPHPNDVVAEKFLEITGIHERGYVTDELNTSDIAFLAAKKAVEDAKIDPETLDYIIFAHNFGNVKKGAIQTDLVPSLATRVKFDLRIKNPKCVAYDMLFGCPGWVEGVIQAQAFIKAGMAKKCLVIGAETLSRVVDRKLRGHHAAAFFASAAGAQAITLAPRSENVIGKTFPCGRFARQGFHDLF